MPKIYVKRGTKSQIDAAASSGSLNAGEPYLITDQNRLAVGTSTTAYSQAVMTGDIGTTVQAYDSDLTAWAGISTSAKQDTLVSGTNIKTINGSSVLGSGDLTVGNAGTVTSVSVSSANGFAGTVANSTTTPAITLKTTITGILYGNGTAISAATAGSDYSTPSGTEIFSNKTLSNPKITNYVETYWATNISGTANINLSNGTIQEWGLIGNATLTLPSSVAGKSFIIIVYYNGGNYTLTWSGGTSIKWSGGTAPTATSVNGKRDIFSFFQDGSTTFGVLVGSNY